MYRHLDLKGLVETSGRFIITKVSDKGKPLEPKTSVTKFVNQCGVVVRGNIPISIQKWKKRKS